jgi:5-methylcytosine-specific restriction protein A
LRQRERLCNFPGCRFLTLGRYCDLHARSTRYHTSPAAKESKRFLNSAAWLKLRALKLLQTPWCEECAKTKPSSVPATQVDHILPRHSHPELRLVYSNLQSLCDQCHGEKTRRGE